jgi:glycosyltransferase involved in cell wall biosynthesis
MSITVITVVKNDLEGLRRTSKSIAQQTLKPYWLVISPNDASDTFQEIQKLKRVGCIDQLIFDNGTGIYSAMNLAIDYAPGKCVWYLNAGDTFPENKTFNQTSIIVNKSERMWAYGGHLLGSQQGETLGEFKPPKIFKINNQLFAKNYISHQSVIFKTSLMKELNGFDEKLRIAADWDLIVRAAQRYKAEVIPFAISVFYLGGLSTHNRQRSNLELLSLRNKYLSAFTRPKSYLWFMYRATRNFIVRKFELNFPDFTNALRKLKIQIRLIELNRNVILQIFCFSQSKQCDHKERN